jgi:hypothetical protein
LRDNNWIIWLIVLGFGWSIAAGIASVMVSQLGFPYTWIMPLTLVMIGTVAILAYRGYPVQAWLLAGCVGSILGHRTRPDRPGAQHPRRVPRRI